MDRPSRTPSRLALLLSVLSVLLFLVALSVPAAEFENGFGATYVRDGLSAVEIAVVGSVLGLFVGVRWWAAAIIASFLNALLIVWSVRDLLGRPRSVPSPQLLRRVAFLLVALTVILCAPHVHDPTAFLSDSITGLHSGGYVWLASLWINWLSQLPIVARYA